VYSRITTIKNKDIDNISTIDDNKSNNSKGSHTKSVRSYRSKMSRTSRVNNTTNILKNENLALSDDNTIYYEIDSNILLNLIRKNNEIFNNIKKIAEHSSSKYSDNEINYTKIIID